jgi:hypothetical protein
MITLNVLVQAAQMDHTLITNVEPVRSALMNARTVLRIQHMIK